MPSAILIIISGLTVRRSSPGALAMYGLSLGVQRINEMLPPAVYALLSGLNASTVGIIALAAVQLAEKAIKDDLTRILVIFGACAGVCYSALWYFPVLMVSGGLATLVWNGHLKPGIEKYQAHRRRHASLEGVTEQAAQSASIPLEAITTAAKVEQRRNVASSSTQPVSQESSTQEPIARSPVKDHTIRVRAGICVILLFFGECVHRGGLHPAKHLS